MMLWREGRILNGYRGQRMLEKIIDRGTGMEKVVGKKRKWGMNERHRAGLRKSTTQTQRVMTVPCCFLVDKMCA